MANRANWFKAITVEKNKPQQKHERDTIGAIYFGAFAILCIYDILSGAASVSAFSASPLLFILLVSGLFMLLLYFARLASALKMSVVGRVTRADGDKATGTLLIAAMVLFLAYALYGQLESSQRQQVFTPMSIIFVAIAAAQVVAQTYPKEMALRQRQEFFSAWLKSAVSYGAAPGVAAVCGVAMYWLASFILISIDGRAYVVRWLVIFLILGFATIRMFRIPLPVKETKWKVAAIVLAIASVFLSIASPALLPSILKPTTHFASFAIAYVVLACIEYVGWRVHIE